MNIRRMMRRNWLPSSLEILLLSASCALCACGDDGAAGVSDGGQFVDTVEDRGAATDAFVSDGSPEDMGAGDARGNVDGGNVDGGVVDGGVPEDSGSVGGELKAFPSAFGGGSSATGGRGGAVMHVTNLNNSGPGSFREAFRAPGARTIVFDVSGTIECATSLQTAYGDVTIAGQTAPAGGITFTGATPTFEISGRDNMVLRYIRIRPRFDAGNDNGDALQFFASTNIMVDHVSISWGADEAMDITGASYNATVQNSLLAESKTGMLMGNGTNPSLSGDLSALGNLWFQVDHRHPNSSTNERIDVINNVIWGYGFRLNRPAPSAPRLNEINNYYITDVARALFDMNKIDYYPAQGPPQIFSRGNLHLPATVVDAGLANNNNTWSVFGARDGVFGFQYEGTDYYDDDTAPAAFFSPVAHPAIGHPWPTESALQALEHVRTSVGANVRLDGAGRVIADVDSVDTVYLGHIDAGTLLTVAYPFTMAGKAHYEAFLRTIDATRLDEHPSDYDSDQDGMPDEWERANGFDASSPDDAGDADDDGYTNLEEFLDLVDL